MTDPNDPAPVSAPTSLTAPGKLPGASLRLINVVASAIVWHPELGLEHDDFERVYAAAAQPEIDRLRAALSPLYNPLCFAIDDRYGVIGEIPTALAVMKYAVEQPRAKVAVALVTNNLGAASATSLFDVKQPRRPWEQAQYVRQNIGDGSVRDYLKQRNLPERFETSISKAKKLLALDPTIIDLIDPMTITSIAQAGRVVTAWAAPRLHAAMAAALALQKRDTSYHRLDARPAFAAMLKSAASATAVPKAATTWTLSDTGFEAMLVLGGCVTLTRGDGGWSMACTIVEADDLKAIGALPLPSGAFSAAEPKTAKEDPNNEALAISANVAAGTNLQLLLGACENGHMVSALWSPKREGRYAGHSR